ncbi:MAG: type I restriction-modification system subunit M [Oscillospiraceae bacterium]|nr:type I restriction-modification system subunit M [Oscillospiraceae bacterium]
MAKKKTEEKINLDSILFKCRDILRKARNSGSFFEKRDMMLTLVFLRFIGEKFEDGVENLRQALIAEGLDPDDEAIKEAFLDDPTFTDGTYNLPIDARWATIINTPAPKLNVALDTALHSIATSSKQLKGCFVEGTFTMRNLAPNDIKQVVDEINKISHKAFGEEKDLIGRVYEYFLKEFAVNATKEEGEFYTPHDVVQLIAAMIEPFDGTLYDPCCGSGGMFVQSTDLIRKKHGDISRINVYGQEKEAATYRLAKMNLALRGISHSLGDESDSTFTHDLHKGLYFNYIMANPPFNLKNWYDGNLKNDSRWADYTTPPESNANYAWILHMLSHLKPLDGVAGFLLANGALGDSDTSEIRKKLIQNDKVEAIVILPRELFITTDISVTLWILNQNKKGGEYHGRTLRNRRNEILFIDLRTWTDNPVKNEGKKKVFLSSKQIQKAADIYHTWQNEGTDGKNYAVPELYRSVGISEIKKNGWSLVPSKYIEFIDHDLDIDYEKEMARIQIEMREILTAEKESQAMLEAAFRGIGYGIDQI